MIIKENGKIETKRELSQRLVQPLLSWFGKHARRLPWRDRPEPYYIWISEIMLQQTRVEAVRGYFDRFVAELPDIAALAAVEEEKLLKLWEGLGYYSRAKNLKKAAGIVIELYGGCLPSDPQKLRELPGIGEYTAGAIASIAFGKRAAAVDGNVLRVMMRLWGSRSDITKNAVKKQVASQLESVMPESHAGAFSQALMELGALVCLPNGRALCGKCPASDFCVACRDGLQAELPVKPPKKPRRVEEKTVLVLETDQGILIRKRPAKGILAGLWEYPQLEGKRTREEVQELLALAGLSVAFLYPLGEAKHIFSHIEWHMAGYYARLAGGYPAAEDAEVTGIAETGRVAENATENAWSVETGRVTENATEAEFLRGCLAVPEKRLQESYSIPAAFDAYRNIPHGPVQKEEA